MAHLYEVGTRVWQPDQKEGWIASEVEQKLVRGEQVKLILQLANGEVRNFYLVHYSFGEC
jgi:myosin V